MTAIKTVTDIIESRSGIKKLYTNDIDYYLECPRRYKLNNWKRKITELENAEAEDVTNKLPLNLYVSKSLLHCIKYMYKRHALDGKLVTLGSILKLWNKAFQYIAVVYAEQEKELRSVYLHGNEKIKTAYRHYKNNIEQNKRVPVIYNYTYILNYDNVDIVGSIDFTFVTVYKTKTANQLNIGFIDEDNKNLKLKTNYNILFAAYKLQEDFNIECKHVLYYDLKKADWHRVRLPYNTDELYEMIIELCRTFSQRISFRHPGKHCNKCEHKNNALCKF